jgi:hypothetical protein
LYGSISPVSQALSSNIVAARAEALAKRMRILLTYIKEMIIISVRMTRDTNLICPAVKYGNQ